MNPAHVLGLLSDMYGQVTALQEQLAEVTQERDMLAAVVQRQQPGTEPQDPA